MSEDSFIRLNQTLASIVENLSMDGSGVSTGTTVGSIGPMFVPNNTTHGIKPSKSVGAKPTRTFVWLGDNIHQSTTLMDGKRVKFDRSLSSEEMLALLKREFPDIGAASTITYYKMKSSGNHALYFVGDDLSAEVIKREYKSTSTRVFISNVHDDNMPAGEDDNEPPQTVDSDRDHTNSTFTGQSRAVDQDQLCIKGELGPQYHTTCFTVGVVKMDMSDQGLYYPGLLHATRLEPLNSAIRDSKSAGLPFVGVTFQCLCRHIYNGPRIAVVIVVDNEKKLTTEENKMLSNLREAYIAERMASGPDPLIWISSKKSLEGMEAIQVLGGQSLSYPQVMILSPSLRGTTAPMLVERFSESLTWTDFIESIHKAKEGLDIVQLNRQEKEKELALKRQQEMEFKESQRIDSLKDKKRNAVKSSIIIDSEETIDEDKKRNAVKSSIVIDSEETIDEEKQIRESRALRVQPEAEIGVEIRVLSPFGMFLRTFPKTGFYQEVYDWLGSNKDLPLYFLLEHQATNKVAYPKDNLEPHRHVLRLLEKDETEMKKSMSREEVTFLGTIPSPLLTNDSLERKRKIKDKLKDTKKIKLHKVSSANQLVEPEVKKQTMKKDETMKKTSEKDVASPANQLMELKKLKMKKDKTKTKKKTKEKGKKKDLLSYCVN